ncbi:hypothetical protein CDD81_693 [Ophiocordyceps australis]|uniref:Rhodopsin domain-containing protein n=1 Tax=Ophiocordyceps australis TaxID=1399860 RepID=A0A2C5Y1V7_9HYPO|nr:hypothetical protein CDD81_693 [Ophiocordyceps australis]
MAERPFVYPPVAVVPDFVRPHNENALGYGVIGIALSSSTAVIILRLYSRWFVLGKPTFGDYALIAAYVLFVAVIALVFEVAGSIGLSVHQNNLKVQEIKKFIHIAFNATIIFSVFIALAKASILLEWIRIFVPRGTRNLLFWACHLIMWTNIIFYLVVILYVCILCTPLEDKWDHDGTCRLDTGWTSVAAASVNLATDICIFLLPQRVIWRLHMTTRRKFGVAAMFSIGILGAVAAAVRLGLTVIRVRAQDVDSTFAFSSIVLCALAEGTCAFIVVCGPALPQAFSHTSATKLRSFFGSRMSFFLDKLHVLWYKKQGETISSVELPKRAEEGGAVVVCRTTFGAVLDLDRHCEGQYQEPLPSKNRQSQTT